MRPDERGSGALLIGFVMVLLGVAAVGVGVWAQVSIAEHRAAALADLAALDAAAAVRDGTGDGCAVAAQRLAGPAARSAGANVRLVECRQRADRVRVVVGLDVAVGRRRLPVRVVAEAGQDTQPP